jgi:hypothetical protein
MLTTIIVLPSAVQCQDRDLIDPAQKHFEAATSSLYHWIRTLSQTEIASLVAAGHRAQLADKLHDLNVALFDVEQTKGMLISAVRDFGGTAEDGKRINDLVVKLGPQLQKLDATIREVAVDLRERFQTEGMECSRKLALAEEQKAWVFTAFNRKDVFLDPQRRAEIVNRGETAIATIREASLEVSQLRSKLVGG